MSLYQFTKQSAQDLIQIRRFTLEHWGPKQSMDYLERLRKTLELLSEMPLIGKNCLPDLGKDIYRFPFSSHMIYYLIISETEIVITALLHQSMVPGKHLKTTLVMVK